MKYIQLSFDDIPELKDIFDQLISELDIDETPTKGDLDLSNDEIDTYLNTHDEETGLEDIEHALAHNILDFLHDPDQLLQAVKAYALFKAINS